MSSLKILIVGGGVAGPAAAYWLSRIAGTSITLIERTPTMRTTGQQLDLRGQGVPAMKKMGIEAAVRAACVHEPGTRIIDTNGRSVAFFAATEGGSAKQSFTSEFEIMRGDLVRILYGLTENRPNVKHLFGTTVESFTQDAGKVHVRFLDGREEDFDLVVGADGTGSRTRKMMLGPEAPDPRHPLGGYIGFFSIPSSPGDSDAQTYCFLPSKRIMRVIGTRKDCQEFTRVYMMMRGKNPALDAAHKSGDRSELKKAWADLYEGGGWESGRFMDALRHAPEADDLYSTPFEEVRLPPGSWSRERIVLVGDAAHSGGVNGFGTQLALVGAYVLAGELATALRKEKEVGSGPLPAVVQAAKSYEERFRPVPTAVQGGSPWIEDLLSPKSRFGIWMLHNVARVIAYFRLDHGAGPGARTEKWQLPDYPELEGEGEGRPSQAGAS